MKTFSVKNWGQFQHYKDRNPPWIKLHNHLLDDYEFEMLADATKGHLLCIWMLASRTKNKIPFDARWVSKKIGASSKVDLDELVNHGFLVVEQDASKMLQSAEQDDTESVPSEEKRREEERQSREEESRADTANASPKFNFKNELLLLGVDPQVLDDWLIVRKNKKASNTKTALSKIINQAALANLSVNDAVAYASGKDWKGFEAQWYFNDQQKTGQAKSIHNFEKQNYQSGSF